MKKNWVIITVATVLLSACNNKENPSGIFTKVYTTNHLATQTFLISAGNDTILNGTSGTTLFIPRNAFVDNSGNLVKGQVNIQLQEVLTIADIVMANLTTTSDGNFLQSGGMISISATAGKNKLEIAPDKYIGVIMPTDTVLNGMKVFNGIQDNIGINWINPAPIVNNIIIAEQSPFLPDSTESFHQEEMTVFQKQIEEANSKFLDELKNGNHNTFTEDYKTNYIFSIKKLGWANIDRIMDDPRTQEIELITKIENYSRFTTVYVTMVLDYRKMYLPGYMKKEGTYSFTHGDYETTRLPVGEEAIIIATAYKNDIPYFATQKIIITEKQTVSFTIEETTMEKLKAELQKI